MTYQELLNSQNILFMMRSGSHAYGTAIEGSDEDARGVFYQPLKNLFGFNQLEQIADDKNDNTYYELSKFFNLLGKNNPNMMELLAPPEDTILIKNPIMDLIKIEDVLSKLCAGTFGGYAYSQIKKARGNNKKIVNPIDKIRKTPLDFCYVIRPEGGSIHLPKFLEIKGWKQSDCGLANINNFPTLLEMYHVSQLEIFKDKIWFKGIYSEERESNDILLSSIPKGIAPITLLSYNKDGYSKYCKDYREYWSWVKDRNELRFQMNVENDKNYDAKNMMHTFRLLEMSNEIAKYGKINVRRTGEQREFLLKIRFAEFEYDYLVKSAEELYAEVQENFVNSSLPETPNLERLEEVMLEMKHELYFKR